MEENIIFVMILFERVYMIFYDVMLNELDEL